MGFDDALGPRLAGSDFVPERHIDRYVRTSGRTEPTGQEIRVLEAMSRGLTHQQAADMLGLSVWTVKEHLANARFTLRAKNTTGACCEALRRGLIR